MKASVYLIGILISMGSIAQAEVQIFKLMDGSAAYCDSNQNFRSEGSKAVKVELISENTTGDNQNTTLKVGLVKCENSVWVNDRFPSYESYKTLHDVKVEVFYNNYEMLLVDKNSKIILQTTLDHLNAGTPAQTTTAGITKTKENPQDLELLIRTVKTVKADNGVEFSEVVVFGGFRVRIN